MTVAAMPDPVAALVAWLRTQTVLTSLTATRIYGAELPTAEGMPRKAVVVRASGTGFRGNGVDYHTVPIVAMRVDIRCYGETPAEAMAVYRALRPVLKSLRRTTQGTCVLHWCNPETGAIAEREPDTLWPFVHSSWALQASEIAVATP